MVWDQLTDHLQVVYGSVVALAIVVLLTPAVGGMARLLGVVDRPEEGRRPNPRGIPRLGGLAMFLGMLVPGLAFLPLGGEMRGILLGAAVATTVGAVDDFRGLRWWEKLGGQVLAAAIPTWFGIWVHGFTFPLIGAHSLPAGIGVPVTVLGIVAVMNMVNFLDGMDGLAAGVCAIAAFSFCVIDLSLGRAPEAVLTAIVFGSCLGFLRHNFYPARIFMGDSGALLLGFTLASVSVDGLLKTAALATLILPLLVLAVPLIDTSFVVAKRIKYRLPIYSADRHHLHHRFENIGFSHRRAVIYLYTWCGLLALAALATRFVHPHRHGWNWPSVALDAVIGLLALGSSVYVVYLLEIVKLANPFIRRRAEQARAEAARKSA
ncbi:MAG TPA: MraY family glycosyltransferase [Gaiellaceae bacterium]|nr:MraY family glycosyltransferase [Gaiellaceae bacterium]